MSSLFADRESGADQDVSQRNASLSDLALQKLQTKLKLLTETETVSLADSFIGDGGCQVLAKFVREHPGITTLDLRGNNIGAEGLKAIAGLLQPPTAIASLSLEWNNAHQGLEPLAEALAINSTLRTLDLRNNKIGPETATTLARCLSGNTTLQRLDLRWNELGFDGVKPFLTLLETKKCALQQLDLSGNKAPEEAIKLVDSLLRGEPVRAFLEEDASAVSTPRRRLDPVASDMHSRNRSSGSYRRREIEPPVAMTHTRLESQIADMEFVLEQERKRNSDLVAALAAEQSSRVGAEAKCTELHGALELQQAAADEERREIEELLEEEKKRREEVAEELSRLQELYARQQSLAQSQVSEVEESCYCWEQLQVEEKLIEQQNALERAESDLASALDSKARRESEVLGSLKSELEAQIREKNAELARLLSFQEAQAQENKALKTQLAEVQEQAKQTLRATEAQLREEESRHFNATFHSLASRCRACSLDQKLKTVQDLRDSLLAKSQDLQRDLMRAEKKVVETSLAFELEREKLLDQIRDLSNQLRDYQADASSYANQVNGLKMTISRLEGEIEDMRQSLSDQNSAFQQTLGEMMGDQRKEREQWEQQRASTLSRIQTLESRLVLTNAEKRRAMDEYLTLGNELKMSFTKVVQDAIKAHLATLDGTAS